MRALIFVSLIVLLISSPAFAGAPDAGLPSPAQKMEGGNMPESKAEKGRKVMDQLFGAGIWETFRPSEFTRMTVEHLYGDVWQGPSLRIEERSLLTCAILVALGRTPEQQLHFRGARNLGIPREKVEGMIIHVAHYAGWPVAVSAFDTLDKVWPRDGEKKP